MYRFIALAFMLGVSPVFAADVTAGMEKAAVCAACHGINGISVSADIPNLAGQKTEYLVSQLKAFKEGSRKNPLMNAIAPQLNESDMENVAAYFSGLTGATGTAASELPPEIATTRVTFPADYQSRFTRYTTIDFPDRKQVRHYYANDLALKAASAGQPLPDGSYLFVEVFKAKLDAQEMPVKGSDGLFQADKLAAYTAMEKQSGWGADIPEILRNGDWNYAVFSADKTLKTDVNQAKCLACHKPLAGDSYVFSIKQLSEKARMSN